MLRSSLAAAFSAVLAAGIAQSVSSNVLRRRFVMAAHANGSDLDEIRHNAGHAQTRTTRRYLAKSIPPSAPRPAT